MALLFSQTIRDKSQQNINLCYQCKKCAAGCPSSGMMDYQNYQLLRLIELEAAQTVLAANTAWVCVSCKTCSARCPNGIDIAKIMDVVKEKALAAGGAIPEPRIAAFNHSFLAMVELFGRSYEIGLFGIYKLLTRTFLQDMRLGLAFIKRGKLNFWPHRIKRIREVRDIFSQAREQKK
jgi:heterodisulfide reductase subunit C